MPFLALINFCVPPPTLPPQASAAEKDSFFQRRQAENASRPEGLPPSQGACRCSYAVAAEVDGGSLCWKHDRQQELRIGLAWAAGAEADASAACSQAPHPSPKHAGGKYVGFGSTPAPRPGGGGGPGGPGGINVDEVSQMFSKGFSSLSSAAAQAAHTAKEKAAQAHLDQTAAVRCPVFLLVGGLSIRRAERGGRLCWACMLCLGTPASPGRWYSTADWNAS